MDFSLIDNKSNVYITAIDGASIGAIEPNGKHKRLFGGQSLAEVTVGR